MAQPLYFITSETGLAASLSYRFFDAAGDWIGAAITANIFEQDANAGTYGVANPTIPALAMGVHWASNSDATVFGDEIFAAPGYAYVVQALNNLGTGAFAITVTVTDGTDPLQNARVRVSEGINSFSGMTDASGNVTFSLDAATYTVTVTKGGYTFNPTTRTVTGNQAGTLINDLVMTATVIPSPPANPAMGSIYGTLTGTDGNPIEGAEITAMLAPHPRVADYHGPFSIGTILVPNTVSTTSDADGEWALDLFGNADILPSGSKWRVVCEQANFDKLVTIVAGQVQDAADLIT